MIARLHLTDGAVATLGYDLVWHTEPVSEPLELSAQEAFDAVLQSSDEPSGVPVALGIEAVAQTLGAARVEWWPR